MFGKKKKNEAEYDDEYEYDDDYDDAYEDEYEDKYDDKYDDDYDDYDDYDDEPKKRNPLKGFVIALLILVVLLGVIIALLFVRLQSAEGRVNELTTALSTTQTELNRVQAEMAAATPIPAPTAEPTPAPESTPAPTEVPAEQLTTPEPTPVPTPEPSALLKDTITDEMLAGAKRPEEGNWYDSARTKYVAAEYMLAMRWGPSMAYLENGALYRDEAVEALAEEDGWTLIRAQNGFYRWVASGLLTETPPAGAATPAPEATVAPEAPATANNPI